MNNKKVYQFNEYVLEYDKGLNAKSCLTISKIQNGNMYVMSSLYDESADVISTLLDNLQKENQILKENAIHNDKVVDKARWNETIYKSRNDKAKEKLKSVNLYGLRSGKTLISALINDVLDILEGYDENGN